VSNVDTQTPVFREPLDPRRWWWWWWPNKVAARTFEQAVFSTSIGSGEPLKRRAPVLSENCCPLSAGRLPVSCLRHNESSTKQDRYVRTSITIIAIHMLNPPLVPDSHHSLALPRLRKRRFLPLPPNFICFAFLSSLAADRTPCLAILHVIPTSTFSSITIGMRSGRCNSFPR